MMAAESVPPIPPTRSAATPREFFEAVLYAFDRASTTGAEPKTLHYSIADRALELRLASRALAPVLTRAFEHLRAANDFAPDLTIHAWDSASTGVEMLPPPRAFETHIARGEIPGLNGEGIRAAYQLEAGALSMLDEETGRAIFWTRDAAALPYYEASAPLRTILHWWLGEQGRQLVHAGAVGLPDGGALLLGKGGSGKSTTALACLASDLMYASDDYCAVAADPVPTVFSIYATAKKNRADRVSIRFLELLENAPDKREDFAETSHGKTVYFLYREFPRKIIIRFPLRAILIPRITGKPETTLRRASGGAGLLALAPSTTLQLPAADGNSFELMAEIVRQVPNYYLDLGTDLSSIPQVILKLLQG